MTDTCMRCPYVRPRSARHTRGFVLTTQTDELNKLRLCDEHARQFDRDLGMWMQCAELIEMDHDIVSPSVVSAQRPNGSRGTFGDMDAARIRALRERAASKRKPSSSTPTDEPDPYVLIGPRADQWRFTIHAQQRASERGFDVHTVLQAAVHPESSAPSRQGENVFYHVKGNCCTVVDTEKKEIITVYDYFEYLCKASKATSKGIA